MPTAFELNGTTRELNGTTREVDAEPAPADPPVPGDGTVPALRVSGNKLVDADGTTRRLLLVPP